MFQSASSRALQGRAHLALANGTGVVAFVARGVGLGLAGDTPLPLALPSEFSLYFVEFVGIGNASVSLAAGAATLGLYTGPAQGGVALATQQALNAITSAAPNTAGNAANLTLGNGYTIALDAATLYLNVGTANGSPAAVDVALSVRMLS